MILAVHYSHCCSMSKTFANESKEADKWVKALGHDGQPARGNNLWCSNPANNNRSTCWDFFGDEPHDDKDVWDSASPLRVNNTQKPLALMKKILRTFTPNIEGNPNKPPLSMGVIDMCCGSGSTSKAAACLGLHSINLDTDKKQLKWAYDTVGHGVNKVRRLHPAAAMMQPVAACQPAG